VGAILIVAVVALSLLRNAQRSGSDTAAVDAASGRETEAVPEPPERSSRPSPTVEAAPAPPPRDSRPEPKTGLSRRPPTKRLPATPKSTGAEPRALAVLESSPPESLELDVTRQEALPLQAPRIAVVPLSPDTATLAPTAAAWKHSDAEARAAIAQVLTTYAGALESNDLRSVEWVYPELTEREREAWKKFFSVARGLVVTLDVERYAIAESEANVDVRGTYQYWNRSMHRSERAPVRFLATLKRSPGGWRLTAIR
jgi:hypothetical protein